MSECKTNATCSTTEQVYHSKKSSSCDVIRNMEKLANHAGKIYLRKKLKNITKK